jgi:hypothetical protein
MDIEEERARAFLEKYFTAKVKRKIISGEYWKNARPHITIVPVEQDTAQTIHRLQEQNIPTMAFTAKGRKAGDFITQSLQSIDISFSKEPFSNVTLSKESTESEKGFLFQNGILFILREKPAPLAKIDGKGKPLVTFLKALKTKPEKVLFVDNREDLVRDVMNECYREKIPVIGMWYRKCEGMQYPPAAPQKEYTPLCSEDWRILDYTADQIKAYLIKKRDEPVGTPSSQDYFSSQEP